MNQNKALWEKGDFTQIAETMRNSGAALVKKLGIKVGMKVLDLGCGDGTTAIPSARLGANVLGIDISSNLVNAAKKRAEGMENCEFREGDAMDLAGIADETFDISMSIFGAMFAPRPDDVAREMVRVTRKGGRVVMGNWIPGDPTVAAQLLKISSAYTPSPPEGFISPMLWGIEEKVIERFTAAGIPKEDISFERATFTFEADFPPSEFVRRFKTFYGPTMNAFEAAEKEGKSADLESELEALFERCNTGNQNHMVIPATYLLVTVNIR